VLEFKLQLVNSRKNLIPMERNFGIQSKLKLELQLANSRNQPGFCLQRDIDTGRLNKGCAGSGLFFNKGSIMRKCQLISGQDRFEVRCAAKHCSTAEGRRAFTLVEMLVVISIISILMAVLLPAVGAARAAMQKTKCANNLHQLAIGVLAYESVHTYFPPGEVHGTTKDTGYSPWSGNSNHCSWDGRIGMWLNAIYPQLELTNYYDTLNFSVTPQYNDANNRREMQRFFDLFHCPSDPVYNQLTNGWGRSGENAEANNKCNMLNYYAVAGSSPKHYNSQQPSGAPLAPRPHPDNTALNPDTKCNMSDGLFYNDSHVTMGSIQDGTTYTAMLGETWGRVYPNGSPGSVVPAGYPTTEKARGMNGMAYVYFDSPPNSDDPRIPSSAHKIAVADRGSPNRVKSFHRDGAHVACVDGAVHFVNNYVQSATQANANYGVWQYMATIKGQDVVNPRLLNWK
jgi:prepilin-type N-terminal cleavage/methylation domain-containing protein